MGRLSSIRKSLYNVETNNFSREHIKEVGTVISAAIDVTQQWAEFHKDKPPTRYEQLLYAAQLVFQMDQKITPTHPAVRDAGRYFSGRLGEMDALMPATNRHWFKLGLDHHLMYDISEASKYWIIEKPMEAEMLGRSMAAEDEVKKFEEEMKHTGLRGRFD